VLGDRMDQHARGTGYTIAAGDLWSVAGAGTGALARTADEVSNLS
jgi:hypothetical protein